MTESDAKVRVMVVGGGCSGLLIAQALKKAGIPCTIFEQDSSIDARPRDWNFGIYWAQSPLGQCLPDDINDLLLTAQVDNYVPTANDAMPVFHGETGEKIKEIPAPYSLRLGKKKFTRLLSRGLNIEYNKRISGISRSKDAVTATFEDGTTYTADLLIGAEGAHSPIREFLLGPEKAALTQSPIVASITVAHLTAAAASAVAKIHPRFNFWLHPSGDFGYISLHESYGKSDRANWQWMFIQSWRQEDSITLTGDAIIDDMKRRAKTFADPYRTIVQAIPDGTKAWHNRLSYWPTQPWDNLGGKVTLAGDAAHPMTFHRGQGLNNAILDAAAILQQLQAVPEKTPEALAAAVSEYEKEVWQRGKEAVESSAQNSLMLHNWAMIANSPLLKAGVVQKAEGQQTVVGAG